MQTLKNNFAKLFKHQSLLRFFFVAIVFSFIAFFLVTGFTVGLSQYKNFNKLTKKYELNQLKVLELNIDQYISNRIKVLKDLASYPLVIDSVMNMKEEDPLLLDFFSLFKVFGEKGKKALLDIDHNLLYAHQDLSMKDFDHGFVDEILNKNKKRFVALKGNKTIEIYLPVSYSDEVEGVLYYSQEFDLMDLFGDLKGIGVSLKSVNDVEIKKNFDENAENLVESDFDKFGLKLSIASNDDFGSEIIFKSLLNIFLSLFLGSLISAVFVFVYGKKYLLEPFEKLEKAESKLELALDASGIGTWYWDVKTGVVTWDDYIYKVYGARKTDFQNTYESFESFVLLEDRAKLKEQVQVAIESNTTLDSEFRITRADSGEIRHIGVKAKTVFNEDGDLVSMTGVNFDITNLKELDHKLKISQQELSMILDALPAYIFYKDNQNTILRANQYAADSLNVSKEEMENQPTEKFYPDLAQQYLKDDLEVINSGQAKLNIEEEYAPVDGARTWIRTDKIPLKSFNSDKVDSILVMATDITDEKIAKEELEKSNKSFQEFAYFVSHDLQEPIRTVSNYVELLLRHLDKKDFELDPSYEKYTQYIKDSTHRIRNMIQEILAYSRVGTGGEYVKVDLNLVVEEIIDSLAVIIEERRVQIDFSNLPTVKARKFEMVQLFQNMIVNAINYTPKERQPKIEISYEDIGTYKMFHIEDNGIGIKEENYDKIFDLFKKLEKDSLTGTGVGLAICKKVIDNYNGDISIDSVYGEGTKFSFTLKL